jgi:hypothetical protein
MAEAELKPASIVSTRPGAKVYCVLIVITPLAVPPVPGNVTDAPVDIDVLRESDSAPLYVSGMLAVVLVIDAACAAMGMKSNPSPPNATSAFRRTVFVFTSISPSKYWACWTFCPREVNIGQVSAMR